MIFLAKVIFISVRQYPIPINRSVVKSEDATMQPTPSGEAKPDSASKTAEKAPKPEGGDQKGGKGDKKGKKGENKPKQQDGGGKGQVLF